MIWRILSIISLILCIILIAVFNKMKRHHPMNSIQHTFKKDKVINKKWLSWGAYIPKTSINRVFITSGELADIIDQYIISHEKRKCSLICKYVKKFNDVSMKVFVYDKNQKLIGVYRIKESGQLSHSSIINLPFKCGYVNIVIDGVDDLNGNGLEKVIKNIKDYKKLLIIETYALFFGLLPIPYITLEVIGVNIAYFSTLGVIISIISVAMICLINYLVILRLWKKEIC